ncbi:MAG: ISKra4 family transposase, partial [Anaerolineae bacterium]|nr:ISKra4 family transposase [Anaerolineae bacterium]NIQ82480.1 ISKra4 family transposase [Anaerolineae bacterium]
LRNGEVILKRRYFICPRCKAKATPLDRVLGLEGRYSQMVDELMGLVDVLGSSRKAEEMLWRLSGLRISYRVIHQKAVELGEELEELQQSSLPGGRLPADTSRAYTSADGVMVNTKTGYHEMKLACLWSEGNDYRRYTATMEPCDKFGQKVRRMVCLAGGHTIDELVAIADGAAWIWEQVRTRLPFVSTQIVDFYHAAEQIATAARALHGEGTQAAKNWLRDARHVLRHEGGRALLKKLKKSRHYRRGNEAIHALVGYISKHVQRMDYPRLKSAGLTIGSGLIESGCKNVVQMRLKGPGMRWRPEAASAVANLRGLFL